MKIENYLTHPSTLEASESRIALQLTALMTEQSETLPHDVAVRLRFSREKAVQRAREMAFAVQETMGTAILASETSGALRLHPSTAGGGWWTRLGSMLPLAALVLGLLFIQNFHQRSQISAAAEVDAALLASDVPFSAYADPGFVEFLKTDGH